MVTGCMESLTAPMTLMRSLATCRHCSPNWMGRWTAPARGATALHVAAEAGHLDVVRCLLDFRADPHSALDRWQRPWHAASVAARGRNEETSRA